MLERKKVRAANEDLPVIMEMNAASKMKLEKHEQTDILFNQKSFLLLTK